MSKSVNKTDNIFYVYVLIDPKDNVPFYIGKGYNDRMCDHEKHVLHGKIPNNNKHLYYKIKKILKNGKPIVYKKILENVNEECALIEESNQISKIGRADLKLGPLCNLTNGGDGVCGLYYTEEMRKHRSELSSGANNPMFNKNHSDEVKRIISEKRKSRAFKYHHTEEYKAKLRHYNPGGVSTSKEVYQIDVHGNVITKWKSIRNAAKILKLSAGDISTCININKNYRIGKCFWRYTADKDVKNGKLLNVESLKISANKKLNQIDTHGNVIKVWNSITNACSELGIVPSMITWASKNNKKHKNFYWKIL